MPKIPKLRYPRTEVPTYQIFFPAGDIDYITDEIPIATAYNLDYALHYVDYYHHTRQPTRESGRLISGREGPLYLKIT